MIPYRTLMFGLLLIFAALKPTSVEASNPDLESWTAGAMLVRSGPSNSEFRFNAGGGYGFGADFHGSDDYSAVFLPLLDLEWRGTYFFSTQRGIGVNLVRRRQTKAGPRITYSNGRKSSGNSDLTGMADLDPSYELGVFIQHFSGPWRFDADMRYGINDTGHNGILAHASLALGGRLSERSSLILGGQFHWANADYMIKNYGVTTSEVQSGRTAYTPTAALRDFGGYATVVYNVTDHIYISIDGRGDVLMSTVTASPIVKADMQYYLGTVLGVRF